MYINTNDINKIVESISAIEPQKDEILFIMLGEQNSPDLSLLVEGISKTGHIFFGGLFPGLIHKNKKVEEGVIIKKFKSKYKPYLVKGLDQEDFSLPDFGELDESGLQLTAIVLIDGLTSNISAFLSGIFNKLGHAVNYLGGGAGSLSLLKQPCLFTNAGVFQDAAIVALMESQSKLGVKHGWEPIREQFIATKTENNIIKELNWQNAFDVYKKTIEKDSGLKIGKDNFFDIAKAYPFGISRENEEYIVRDPISVNKNGELLCVGEVPENTVLDILKGMPKSLINAARLAALDCKAEEMPTQHALIFDCISRVLFLEGDFNQEINEVYKVMQEVNPEIVPEGVLSLGEISSHQGYLEFFNKTIVVGLLS
jgi:hypothetical protein